VWKISISNPYSIYVEINSRLKLGNTCYHLEQNLFSSMSVYKNIKNTIQRIIILPVLLFCCETWFLTLRMEQRLSFFESRILGKIFGPERDEVTWERKGLFDKEIYDLYSSPNVIWVTKSRRMRRAGAHSTYGKQESCKRFLVEKRGG